VTEEKTSLADLAPKPEEVEKEEGLSQTEPAKEIRVKRLPGGWIAGIGRRKTSVARVRIKAGTGAILVNGKPFDQFFNRIQDRLDVLGPLEAAGVREKYDVHVRVEGGGPTGQAGAIRLGIARALRSENPALEGILRAGGHLSRDSRMVERKKYGLHKARKATQFSKR